LITPFIISKLAASFRPFSHQGDSWWFANLPNPNTQRAYRQDIDDFMAFASLQRPEHFLDVTRAHVIAWRDQLVSQGLANDSIRRKLAAYLRSLPTSVSDMRAP
jgi:site-specific recombinase XerD